jgi:hypothetical protein
MTIRDDYMISTDTPNYDIDKDISVQIYYHGNSCYVSVYNDRNDSSVAFCVTKEKLKGLADFIYKTIEEKK